MNPMQRFLVLLLMTLGLSGCLAPPPAYKDPLSGIVPISASAVPLNASIKVEQPIGLIVSDNTESYIEYQKSNTQVAQQFNVNGLNDDLMRDIDPKTLVDSVVSLLRKRYPKITLVDDMNAAAHAGMKSVFVIDVQAVMGNYSGQTTTVDLTLLAFDQQVRPASKITGHGAYVIPFPADSLHFREAATQALQDLDQKMTRYFR